MAILILGSWGGHLFYILNHVEPSWVNPWMYGHILVQGYFYTGLFITGHDAMHRSVSKRRWLNNLVGYISVFLFAGMSYGRLIKNHRKHHEFPGTEKDPDFYTRSQNFFAWWFMFMVRYTTLWQILILAAIFNLLKYIGGIAESSLIVFWIIPAFLATFQLFYFGTYEPHKHPHTEHMGKHRARTQRKNHLRAMLTCYFFGYHIEHHVHPGQPWWKLYQIKNQSTFLDDH
jgi:beta-carotene ketolase (CrtW type)